MTAEPSETLATLVTGAPAFSSATLGGVNGPAWTSETLAARARKVEVELRSEKIAPDEPVIIFISNAPGDIAGFLGIWQAGAVAVPIHVDTPGRAAEALRERLGARLAVRDCALKIIGDTSPRTRSLLRGAALIVFTSGSTGHPKGVVIGHNGLCWKLGVLSRSVQLNMKDTVAVPLQLTFIFGIWASLLSLMSGANLVLAPKLAKTGFGASEPDITVIAAVPTLLRILCANDRLAGPGLRMIITGGEPCGAELATALRSRAEDARIFDLFGLTETGSCDFCALHPGDVDMRGTIGRATEGVEFRIQRLPELGLPNDVGELQISSPALMLGYLDDPEQTESAFSDAFFRTGDLATRRENGLIQLVGRSKDIVSRGGNKIAPLEIENLFTEHPGIAAVLAFGVPDDRLGESLHLMVVAEDASVSEEDLRAWSTDKLERFKTPDVFHLVSSLPIGRTGKADRAVAREMIIAAKDA